MKLVVLGLLLVSVLSVKNYEKFGTPLYKDGNHVKVWEQWKGHFDKVYKSMEEEARHFVTFLDTWKSICDHNEKYAKGEVTWYQGINQFTDLTPLEFKLYIHGHNNSCYHGKKKPSYIKDSPKSEMVNLPSSVNWVSQGKVTPVKNQGQCGSCWAFSSTGSTESIGAISGKGLTSLSEQQLVDCSGSYGNQGCNGGLMDQAFEYIAAVGGLCSESEYPYTAQDGTCQASSCGTKYDAITGHTDVQHDSTTALMTAIAQQPVSIGVDASGSLWQSYSGGVATSYCGDQLDHGVLAAGYGSQGGQDFWMVKNSWGGSWGDQGYIYLCRNCNKDNGAGECGLMSQPSYPHF